jgi:FAD-dependent urate hydroxylase
MDTDLHSPILIAGAGIGGLTAALALRRHGFPVEVYERRPDKEIQLAGTGLTIWSNATTPLAWLGLGDDLVAAGDVIRRARNTTEKAKKIFETPIRRYTWPDAAPPVSLTRRDLVRVLMAACEGADVPVHLGRRCSGYEAADDGVALKLDDSEVVGGSLLVGADGIRSVILEQLRGTVPALYTGLSTYRGISDGDGGLEPGTVLLFKNCEQISGGAWHVGGGRVAWTVAQKVPPDGQDPPGATKQAALALLDGFAGPPRRLVELTPAEAVIRTDIWYHEWHQRWGEGPVTLLGDAAHAMPTVLGQGACQAIEDAVVLADALAAAADPVQGLRDYERRRLERVRWVRERILAIMNLPEIKNPVLLWGAYKVLRVAVHLTQGKMWRELQRPPELVAGRPALRV